MLHVYEHIGKSESHYRLIVTCNWSNRQQGSLFPSDRSTAPTAPRPTQQLGSRSTAPTAPPPTQQLGVMDSSFDDADQDENVGTKLDQIRAQQQARLTSVDSSDDADSDDEEDGRELRWKQAKLSHSDAGTSQGFSQELSQSHLASSQGLYCPALPPIDYPLGRPAMPVPVYRTIAAQEAARHEFVQYQTYMNANRQPLVMPDYRVDPASPWAPGGIMARPPVAPARRASPALRAPSPAIAPRIRTSSPAASSTGDDSAKKKAPPPAKKKSVKSVAEVFEDEKLQRDIELVINHFKPEYKHKIDCEDERDMKNMEDQELYKVARWLNVNKPVPRKFDLAKFSSKQIRKLAVNCQVRGGGNLTLFQCRRKIAMSITMGTVYDDETIANPKTTHNERKVNTLMRIINACFNNEMKDKFIDLNDAKKRADYEAAHGGNPVKDFWVQVSEFTNDTTRNEELGVVLESREGEDEHGHMSEWVGNGEFNLNDFTLQTYISCQQHMSDCMKARENCLKQLRTSGHNSNDMYDYCVNPSFTKLRKNGTPIPAKAIYYCHLLCVKHPEIDGKFATFLSEQLKSDSAVDLTGSAGEKSEDTRSDKKNKALDTLVMTLASATTEMTSFFAGKKQQQQQQQQQPQPVVDKEDETEARDRLLWSEYVELAGKFLAMKEQSNMLPLLCNFAIRIRKLEKLCGIPSNQSVTLGVAGIPTEVVVTNTVATVGTSTSDVTSNK